MDFTLIPPKSALRKFWSPKLTFTGTSVMGVNPANGAKLHVRKAFLHVAAPLPLERTL